MDAVINKAKEIERRFCGHHPDTHPEPLSTRECIRSVVDSKNTGKNKHRYIVATQDYELRRELRGIPGVPLIYINRGVMIMEPMAEATTLEKVKEERVKFKAELKTAIKRKRGDEEDEGKVDREVQNGSQADTDGPPIKRKKKNYGKAKGPNPLSAKKKKKKTKPRVPQNAKAKKMAEAAT